MIKDYLSGKRVVEERKPKGRNINICASLDNRYVCCGTMVLSVISNCPYNCSYCFLQNYLTDTTRYYLDIEPIILELHDFLQSNKDKFYRIGTWELGDSLATQGTEKLNISLIEAFAFFDNALLELKTKSDRVDFLLNLKHGMRTVISWSLNTEKIIREEEIYTASLEKRIIAMKKVIKSGYLLGFHFDPIIFYENFLEDYIRLIRYVFSEIPPQRVAWISLGSLRYNPEMRKLMKINFPYTKLLREEMIAGNDNKMRYPRHKRSFVYKILYSEIMEVTKGECFVYLCMERPNVWRDVFDNPPQTIRELDELFSANLKKFHSKQL